MNVHFFSPPPKQREGGLDAAIEGLRAALIRAGATVDDALPERADGEHVAHFHGLWQPAHLRAARRCRQLGIPYVVSPHGMLERWALWHKAWKKWPYFHLVEKRHLSRAAALFATGSIEAARLKKLVPRARVENFPLGMTGAARPDYEAARARLGWGRDECVLLFLFRLHPKKGLGMLLRALTDVGRPDQTRLVIVGGGQPRYVRSMRALAEKYAGMLPRIDWVGEVWGEERWPYFQGADLFCLPTFSENFGLAVLEACQVGTPVLTTTATPWVEHFADGRGFISKPHRVNLCVQLCYFFTRRARDGHNRQALADWARATFDWDALAPRYLECYRSLRP